MFEHPLLLVVAIVVTVPVLRDVARFFFGSWNQFAEDLGLTTSEGRWALLRDNFGANGRSVAGMRGIFLNILWFAVSAIAVVAMAYHLLALAIAWIRP